MKVRQKPRLARNQLKEGLVHFDPVERREPQTLQSRFGDEQPLAQHAKAALASTSLRTGIIRNVDAGEHDLLCPPVDLASDGIADDLERKRDTRAACLPDRAEGTAMVAARLDRNEAPHMSLESSWRHDVIRCQAVELVRISDDAADLGHALEAVPVELGRASGHQNHRVWTTTVGVSDRLARLADGLVGHRAAIHNDPVFVAGRGPGDCFALREVESASKGDGFYAHCSASRSSSPLNT